MASPLSGVGRLRSGDANATAQQVSSAASSVYPKPIQCRPHRVNRPEHQHTRSARLGACSGRLRSPLSTDADGGLPRSGREAESFRELFGGQCLGASG